VGLEDDRKLHSAWLLAGLLSEAGLIGMLITSLHEVGRGASVVVALVAAGLALAMSVHLRRYRLDGQRRIQPEKRHASRPPALNRQPGFQPNR
jgi:crotonobetainyl-CoA:carnitine CoA-transferase CaiB-like acyl-CoA transferase